MGVDFLQASGTILALATTAYLLYGNVRKAPIDRRLGDMQAAAAATTAITNYSNEVVRLQDKVDNLRETMEQWEDGIEILIKQILASGGVPAWRPASRLREDPAEEGIVSEIPVTAKIIVTREAAGRISYAWEGPEDGTVAVTYELLKSYGIRFRTMPWKLVEVGRGERVVYYRRREYAHVD